MSEEFKTSKNNPQKYRLVVMNDETFEEVGSYRLSLFNLYSAISTILLLVVLLVVSIIIFTPIKRYIPGYDADNAIQAFEMYKRIDSLERDFDNREFYIQNVRKVLTGNIERAPEEEEVEFMEDTIKMVTPIKEDLALRNMVAQEEMPALPLESNFESKSEKIDLSYIVPPIREGFITSGFAADSSHLGIDIAAPRNTPIRSILNGRVFIADWTLDTGYIIGIQHENNIISFYKHNSVLLKKVNSFVKAGEAIAIIGNTGHLSDGPHLHFEIWINGQAVNPSDYIKF